MTVRGVVELSDRVEQVIDLLRERFARKAEGDGLQSFARQYFSRVAPEDILNHSVENLYGAILSLWRFAEKRLPGQLRLRIFRPRIEQEGWISPHTIIEIVNDDMPFLVDSVTMTLANLGRSVHLFLHPIIKTHRDSSGKRTMEGGEERSESLMHIEIGDEVDPTALKDIEQQLSYVLKDVRVAVEDWKRMQARLEETIKWLEQEPPPVNSEEVAEAAALLRWMGDNHFTFIGSRDYDYRSDGTQQSIEIVADSGLGILRDPARRVMLGEDGFNINLPQAQDFLRRKEILIVTKTNARSTVHRPVPLDYIGIRRFDKAGNVIGERRFVGLFTSAAYNRNPRDIPLLRRKVARVLDRAGLDPRSHDGKALMNLIETYPRDELLHISEDDLYNITSGILQVQLRPRLRLFVRRDEFGRFVSCLIFVPRDRYDTRLRRRFEKILADSFGGRVATFATQLGDDLLARIHFIVQLPPNDAISVDVDAVEERLRQAARAWTDDLQEVLAEKYGEAEGDRLWRQFGQSFPTGYTELYNARIALADLAKMDILTPKTAIAVNLYRPLEAAENELRFKIYRLGKPVPLSGCLPMLEHMGLTVQSEQPFEIGATADREAIYISDFSLQVTTKSELNIEKIKPLFESAFLEVWSERMENDGFNRLVLLSELNWHEVTILRAYAKYLRQIGSTFSQSYMEDTLVNNAGIARQLIAFFKARFDPALTADRQPEQTKAIKDITDDLEKVASLDEDRILRRFLNLIQASLRTNYYQTSEDGTRRLQLSIKFDSALIDDLPLPRPWREIFVYSVQVEGVHLRGGKVARGGLRWSDRREDFRTEVLGLMKAQMVKNAVIVPVGAKGGFVPKRPPLDKGRDAVQADGVACYQMFVRGLLDITDNRVLGKVAHPKDVVRHDEDDPYLVVAADKGTATFSDIANAISAEYSFWLGDAFASGGSAGYDHKKMGITARGAWETVKRHFREFGKDIMAESFTVAGIGDMSGDVFGNGMLLSPHIRLLAAFDHRHIFIDPNPDTAKSFAERKRLFELPRSSWADYDQKLISVGGGVFDRKAKSIKLTPQIQALLNTTLGQMTPLELMQHILKLDVDLLWNGGIGTYVKGALEGNAEVGDRANDALRVNGVDLRAKVVGEGGNLGFTQRGRIEYALKGGRINTDAVDNSAGVDCSDHEVNIKILLNSIVADGELTERQRDRLLSEMTDEVGHLVLQDNYLQSQAMSMMQAQGASLVPAAGRFIRKLELEGRLNRAIEFLPDEAELTTRWKAGTGLTRPELAVLLAYAKTTLYTDLLESNLPEDSYFTTELPKYFPRPLRRQFSQAIARHDLRREIVTTATANSLINRMGVDFISEIAAETQSPVSEITRAYAVVRDVFELRRLWSEIESLDTKVPTKAQTEMLLAISVLVRRATLWFLRRIPTPISIAETVKTYGSGFIELREAIANLLPNISRARMEADIARLTAMSVPESLARSVSILAPLGAAPDIIDAARHTGHTIKQVGACYFSIGDRLGFDWLRETAMSTPQADDWQRLAVTAMVDDLFDSQRRLAQAVVEHGNGKMPIGTIEDWEENQGPTLDRLRHLIGEFRATGGVDAARLAIANRQIRALTGL